MAVETLKAISGANKKREERGTERHREAAKWMGCVLKECEDETERK